MHVDIDLVLGVDRQVTPRMDFGPLGLQIVAGRERQIAAAIQIAGLQAFGLLAVVPTAGAQAGGMVALITAFAGFILLDQPAELHVALGLDFQRVARRDRGAKQLHILFGGGQRGILCGADGAADLLMLFIITADVVLPGVEPLVVGVALSLFQFLTVERQAGTLQADLFTLNIDGAQVVAVIGQQADVFTFQLSAGQSLAVVVAADVDATAIVLVVITAGAAGVVVTDLALGTDVVGFHPDLFAALQLARQPHTAAGSGMDDIDAACLHAAKIVAVRCAEELLPVCDLRLLAAEHLCIARYAVVAADGIDI
ncbi:hypothetical protein D3C81_1197610 [compost metagenome]